MSIFQFILLEQNPRQIRKQPKLLKYPKVTSSCVLAKHRNKTFPVWIPEITHLHKTSLICEDAEKLQFLLSAAVTLSVKTQATSTVVS